MRPEIQKNSNYARLFKYHPERFFILRSYPEWADAVSDKEAWSKEDKAANIISVGENLLFQHMETGTHLNDAEHEQFPAGRLQHAMMDQFGGQAGALEQAVIKWKTAGEQIFDLSAIAALYLDADAAHVPLASINLPFEAFYIYWGAHLEIKSPNNDRYIDGCYVHRWKEFGEDEVLFDLTFTSALPRSDPWDERSLLANVVIDCEGVIAIMAVAEKEDSTVADMERLLTQNGIYEPELSHRWAPYIHQALNMAANCMCYLSWDKAELREEYPAEAPAKLVMQTKSQRPTEQRRAASKLEALGFRMVRIGGEKLAEAIGLTPGQRNVPPHWRRGHWRHQKHGKGRELIKLIWIQASIVNKNSGDPQQGHIYRP